MYKSHPNSARHYRVRFFSLLVRCRVFSRLFYNAGPLPSLERYAIGKISFTKLEWTTSDENVGLFIQNPDYKLYTDVLEIKN